MNNLIIKKSVFIFLIAIFTFFACDNDFLDKGPLNKISPKDYFKKARDLEIYVNGFYPSLPIHGRGSYGPGLFGSDDGTDNALGRSYGSNAVSNNKRLAGERTVNDAGGYSWGNVRNVNYFFAKLPNSLKTSTDANVKQYIGEAYFFRAWYYFILLKRFGDLPIIDTILNATLKETALERKDRAEVVDFMVKDLDSAISKMKDGAAGESGRVNKHVALAFKARVCLFEGTWEKYHSGGPFAAKTDNSNKFLGLARDAADIIIKSGKYSLYKGPAGKEYSSLFNKTDYSSNTEVIFWAKYDTKLDIFHNVQRYLPRGVGPQLTKNFVDDVLMKSGKKIKEDPGYAGETGFFTMGKNGKADIKYNNTLKDRDPRLFQIVHTVGKLLQTNIPNSPDAVLGDLNLDDGAMTGYPSYKGADPSYTQTSDGSIGTTGAIIFRYAEVLLIYAEAQAELGDEAEAIAKIDLLRDRVGMAKLSAVKYDGYNIIDAVRRERRVELVQEGKRLYDILRWKAASTYIIDKKPLGMKYVGNKWVEDMYDGTFKPIVDVEGKLAKAAIDTIELKEDDATLFVDSQGFIEPNQKILKSGWKFKEDRDYLDPIDKNNILLSDGKLEQNPGGWN